MAELDAARDELVAALGADAVLHDPLALRLYARDASMVEGSAGLVVFVRSAEDVVVCMQVAARHDLPVVPRGSGTGLAGGATPLADAIVVVTAKMNRMLEVRPEDRLAWVEPGVFNLDLGNALRPTGFTYAPDPSSQQVSSIGGNVNTNAGGPHCLAYGVTSAHVLAVDVVLPDGSVERFGSEAPAAAGYDLRGYVVGSEGTLGVVTAACVRLTPLPPAVRTMLLDFADVEDCAQTVSAIVARGCLRDRAAARPDRHERLPRGRRQPASAVLVRPIGARNARTRAGGVRRARAALRRRRRFALRRARDRSGEARLHGARVHYGRPGRPGLPASGLRPRREDESAQGPARRRPLRRLRGSGARTPPRAPGGHVDLIHPHSKRDVVDALRTASAAETRVLIVGGRRHMDKGNPSEVDAELWTTVLDDRVAYDPAEMLCVVEAGQRIHH